MGRSIVEIYDLGSLCYVPIDKLAITDVTCVTVLRRRRRVGVVTHVTLVAGGIESG